MCLILVFFAA